MACSVQRLIILITGNNVSRSWLIFSKREVIKTKRKVICLLMASFTLVLSITGCGPKIYNDGTYKGVSPSDDKGFAVAEVTVENDKITSVKLAEFTNMAMERDLASYEWEAAKLANQELPNRIIESQDANVDAYTGATVSSNKYILAVTFALEKAKKNPDIATEYFDGTFLGRSTADDKGYGVALVTIEKDKITGVRLLEVTEENQFRDFATYSYTPVIQAKEQLEKAFTEKNSPQVDTFSEATQSSQKWIEAVSNAMKAARFR